MPEKQMTIHKVEYIWFKERPASRPVHRGWLCWGRLRCLPPSCRETASSCSPPYLPEGPTLTPCCYAGYSFLCEWTGYVEKSRDISSLTSGKSILKPFSVPLNPCCYPSCACLSMICTVQVVQQQQQRQPGWVIQNINFRSCVRLPRYCLRSKFLVVVAILTNLKYTKFQRISSAREYIFIKKNT